MGWEQIFGATQDANAGQLCARAALVFVYGWLLVRIGGRRAFARWTAIDIVVAIVTGSNLSRALTGNADLFGTLAATTVLLVLHGVFAQAASRSPRLSHWLEGRSVRLGGGGRLDPAVLKRHAISAAALEEALHRAGIEGAEKAHVVFLDPNGSLSVLKKE